MQQAHIELEEGNGEEQKDKKGRQDDENREGNEDKEGEDEVDREDEEEDNDDSEKEEFLELGNKRVSRPIRNVFSSSLGG